MRLIVKFKDDFQQARPDPTWFAEFFGGSCEKVRETLQEATIQRILSGPHEDELELKKLKKALQALIDQANQRRPSKEFFCRFRLLNYFTIQCFGDSIAILREVLGTHPDVEFLYLEFETAPPSNEVCVSILRLSQQDQAYLGPQGVNATYSWQFGGGSGVGLRFVDVEEGWNLEQEDLVDAGIKIIAGENWDDQASHGTAVLGVITAIKNRKGVTGIAFGLASARVVSVHQEGDNSVNIPRAIFQGLCELRFGDVLLIEQQVHPSGKFWMPIEIDPATVDVIRLGTALGIVVVEPAANGRNLLDEHDHFDRFSDNLNDSGAIVVGGSNKVGLSRHPNSNWGSRVDCFAWAELILTTWDRFIYAGYEPELWGGVFLTLKALHRLSRLKDTGFLDHYCYFDGTSGASAIIAGVALCVQGLAQDNLGFRFSPWQLRRILSDPANGTPSANGKADGIGVMPDLRKIIDHTLCLPPQPYVRDSVGDLGDLPRTTRWASPDIIALRSEVKDPQKELGEGSGTENDELLMSAGAPEPGNVIYVRARNRGGEDARGVRAEVYWAPRATVLVPKLWNPVGETTMAVVPTGDLLRVFPPVKWRPETCSEESPAWIALLDDGRDDPPRFEALRDDWTAFLDAVRNSNLLAFRNLHVVEHVESAGGDVDDLDHASYLTLPFLVPGMPQSAGDIRKVRDCLRLEVLSRLPRQARVWLRTEPKIADLQGIWGDPPPDPEVDSRRVVHVPINPNGRHPLRETALAERDQAKAALVVYIPPALRCNPYQIAVRQLWEDEEVGRITFRLVPRRKGEEG